MIVTVTLNPTLDKTLAVPALRPGEVHRARFVRQDIGGKGINVSRALKALGLPSVPIGFLGGAVGRSMRLGLSSDGFDARFVEVPGETRQNLTLLDDSSGVYTKINEPGPEVGAADLTAFDRLVDEMAGPGDLWALCGSLPPGVPDDYYASLVRRVHARGARAVLDTSGEAMGTGLAAMPFAAKPNSDEAGAVLGRSLLTEAEHVAAARAMVESGVRVVYLSRGAAGGILARDHDLLIAAPPPVEARSPVGAGDAALAGLLWSIAEEVDAERMARRCVACGTAAAMQEGTGVGDAALVEELIPKVTVRAAFQAGRSSAVWS